MPSQFLEKGIRVFRKIKHEKSAGEKPAQSGSFYKEVSVFIQDTWGKAKNAVEHNFAGLLPEKSQNQTTKTTEQLLSQHDNMSSFLRRGIPAMSFFQDRAPERFLKQIGKANIPDQILLMEMYLDCVAHEPMIASRLASLFRKAPALPNTPLLYQKVLQINKQLAQEHPSCATAYGSMVRNGTSPEEKHSALVLNKKFARDNIHCAYQHGELALFLNEKHEMEVALFFNKIYAKSDKLCASIYGQLAAELNFRVEIKMALDINKVYAREHPRCATTYALLAEEHRDRYETKQALLANLAFAWNNPECAYAYAHLALLINSHEHIQNAIRMIQKKGYANKNHKIDGLYKMLEEKMKTIKPSRRTAKNNF